MKHPPFAPLSTNRGAQNRWTWLAITALALAGFAAYANSFQAAFTFDDIGAITENPSIKQWSTALRPPPTSAGAVGRPLVNLSLAFNYAIGGLDVTSYHVFNLTVHILAGLALFGILRRTFSSASWRGYFGSAAQPLAFAISLVWLVHPLQTESVVCIIQRNELLVGLFYLFTLYAFIRSLEAPAPLGWKAIAIITCLLGMATKEVMATAPLIILLYDRTFAAGTFRAAWRQRWRFYLGLASTWLLLGWLVAHHAQRSGTVGLGLGVSSWSYLLTQCEAIVLYLRLCFWPDPLIVDYGDYLVPGLTAVLPQAILLVALLAGTIWAVFRRPVWGFVGAFFFIILAPSSSVLPLVTQTIAEHRMYLPLAAVIAVIAMTAHNFFPTHGWKLLLPIAVICGFTTALRNTDYRNELSLLTATVKDRPDNPRAHQDLGVILSSQGRKEEALSEYKTALRLRPGYPNAQYNIANLCLEQGRMDDAAENYEAALLVDPMLTEARYNLANILVQKHQLADAIAHYTEVLRLQPSHIGARVNLANTLAATDRLDEAVSQYREALRLAPGEVNAHYNFGQVLLRLGQAAEAADEFRSVLLLRPDDAAAARSLTRAEHLRSLP